MTEEEIESDLFKFKNSLHNGLTGFSGVDGLKFFRGELHAFTASRTFFRHKGLKMDLVADFPIHLHHFRQPRLVIGDLFFPACLQQLFFPCQNIPCLNPNLAKVGGLQSQGIQGRSRSQLLRAFGNAGSGVLRLSRRVNNLATIYPILTKRKRLKQPMVIV